MLARLIRFSLEYRLVVLLLAVIVIAAGAVGVREAPWDVFPEFAPPQIVVQTEAPGLSTEEVERLVTVPIESALNGVSRVRTLRSSSAPGLCVVTLIFEDGTEILDARQLVGERLTQVESQLPEEIEPPRMTPLAASTSRLAMLGLTSETATLLELRTLADWTFRRRLQAVRGVAHVEVFGGEVKQYQVLVDPQRLRQYHVTLDDVVAAGRSATGFGGAGYVETANQRLPIHQRTRVEAPADLAAAPVLIEEGVPVTLGQVADVVIGPADQPGDATINGVRGVLILVHKQPFFNTLTVSEDVERAIEELRAALPEGVALHPQLFRQAAFIERAIGNLTVAMLIGCGLVTAILIAFLFQWRTVVISLTAIPLSLLGAILVLRGCGASLNAMTLGGLAIALGEVVDDAIVDVENVLRRLRQNALRPDPLPAVQVVLSASLEVRSAVVYASYIVTLVFVPVFFMGGLAGTIFRPLGLAYVSAILVSLLVALTVTPAMCLLLLRPGTTGAARDPLLLRMLKTVYARALPAFLNHRRLTLAASLLLVAASVAALPFLGGEFLPDFRESNFVLFMAGKPDSSLPESMRVGRHVAERLLEIPGVISVAQQTGRADLSEDTWGPNVSEIWIVIDDSTDYETVLSDMRQRLAEVPGHQFQIKQFLRERIDEVLTGTTADIVLRVVGPELAVLRSHAVELTEAISGLDGVEDLRVEPQVDVPQIEILLRPQDAALHGFTVGKLNANVQTFLRGLRIGQVYEHDRVFDVVVRAHPHRRSDPAALAALLVASPTGDHIPLSAVAGIGVVDGPNVINREQASRRMLVTCNAEGRDVASVMQDIRQRIQQTVAPLPAGYHLEFGGEYEARTEASRRLSLLGAAVLVGIFVLLYLDFRSVGPTLMVLLSVPLACVGGLAAVLATGGDVSLGSMVGFITVFGIAIRNGILMISHYRHLHHEEQMPFDRELILRGASERLAPVLMTASTAALALLPLALLGDRPGHEIEHPMAVVIMAGLISSTFLTLLLLPVLYEWLGMRFVATASNDA